MAGCELQETDDIWACVICDAINVDLTASFCNRCQCERVLDDTVLLWCASVPNTEKEEQTWECLICTFINDDLSSSSCEVCDSERIDRDCEVGRILTARTLCTEDTEFRREQELNFDEREEDIRMILIGKTGAGKSATGNTIIGRKKFISAQTGKSQTKSCQREEAWRDGRRLVVVDTPGLFDTKLSNKESMREIAKSVWMTLPGPHAVLLVIEIGRYTEEVQMAVDQLIEHFGDEVLKHMIVVFTRNDQLVRDNMDIEQFINDSEMVLRDTLNRMGNRYVAFDNVGEEESDQVVTLMDVINNMIAQNGGKYFSKEYFEAAEENLRIRNDKMQDEERERLESERQRHVVPLLDSLKKDKTENDVLRKKLFYEELKQAEIKMETQSMLNWEESRAMAGRRRFHRPRYNRRKFQD